MSNLSEAKILVVDDEDILREIYIAYFNKQGIVLIDEAQDGLIALSQCDKVKYDLIILDHRMPHLTGGEVLRKLRSENGLNKETKVLVISGYLEDIPVDLLNTPQTFFAEKPISFKNFESLILQVL